MKEPEPQFSPESIDHLTERSCGDLPAHDRRLLADLYRTYMPTREEHSRSLQRIWSRFAQMQERRRLLQEGQAGPGSTDLTQGTQDVNAQLGRLGAPVPDSFQGPPQPLPRGSRRSPWRRLSGDMTVAIILLIVLSWVLLIHAFPKGSPPPTLSASLTLDGGPQFDQHIVFRVKSSAGGQYLAAISFDTYDGHAWSATAVSSSQLPANKRTISEGRPVHLVTQQITVVTPAGEPQPYVFGAGQIASVDQPTTLLINKTTGSQGAVLRNNGRQKAPGDQYTVQSYVSSADVAMLRAIPLPANAPPLPPNYNGPLPSFYYNPAILSAYLQLPNIDPRVKALAQNIIGRAHATTMYDKAVVLQNYFRTSFTYSTNVQLSPGAEGTAWLLFQSNHHAFCNFFASAMAVMARELGMPARVVIGYTPGTFDAKTQDWVVHGSDAHVWTQIYFAGFGWINFEPSPGFAPFIRPGPSTRSGPALVDSAKVRAVPTRGKCQPREG
jgi:transglutaminase-like putative cysteine protease